MPPVPPTKSSSFVVGSRFVALYKKTSQIRLKGNLVEFQSGIFSSNRRTINGIKMVQNPLNDDERLSKTNVSEYE